MSMHVEKVNHLRGVFVIRNADNQIIAIASEGNIAWRNDAIQEPWKGAGNEVRQAVENYQMAAMKESPSKQQLYQKGYIGLYDA